MLRPTALITYAVAFYSFFFQSRFATGQSIQSSIRQMDEIHRFYRTWSKLYANDLFRSVYPWQLDVPEEMFFDPTKKIIKTKTVIMVRDNEDEEYREQKPPKD